MDYWLIACEHVSYRTTCKHKILYLATEIPFWNIMNAGRVYITTSVKITQVCEWHEFVCDHASFVNSVCCKQPSSETQCDSFGASAIFPRRLIAQHFSFSMTKHCSERTTVCSCQGYHCKSYESTDRGIKQRLPWIQLKALQMLPKVFHCPKELLWIKCVLTYFCIINQFWEVIEATWTRFQEKDILFCSLYSVTLVIGHMELKCWVHERTDWVLFISCIKFCVSYTKLLRKFIGMVATMGW
jgi:hypothetical protein